MIYYSCSSPHVQRVLVTLDDIFGTPAPAMA
jgi:hypothetical protein